MTNAIGVPCAISVEPLANETSQVIDRPVEDKFWTDQLTSKRFGPDATEVTEAVYWDPPPHSANASPRPTTLPANRLRHMTGF